VFSGPSLNYFTPDLPEIIASNEVFMKFHLWFTVFKTEKITVRNSFNFPVIHSGFHSNKKYNRRGKA